MGDSGGVVTMSDREILLWYVAAVLAFLYFGGLAAARAGDLPDPALTKCAAAVTPNCVIAADDVVKLCSKSFHTGTVRDVPQSEKKKVFAEYGVKCVSGKARGGEASCSSYEVDHLISLEIGGSDDINNLWPQSYVTRPLNAHVKDALEDRLHALVCKGAVTLPEAQNAIATNWPAAYSQFVGELPK